MTTKKKTDSRKHPRTAAKLNVSVRYKNIDEFIKRTTDNISKGGIFIESDEVYPRRTRLSFEILLTGGESVLRGQGVVAWCCKPEDASSGRPGMGIKFTVLDKSSKKLIDAIVDNKDGNFDKEIVGMTIRPQKPGSGQKSAKKTQPPPDATVQKSPVPDALHEEVKTKSESEKHKKQLDKQKAIAIKTSAKMKKLEEALEESAVACEALENKLKTNKADFEKQKEQLADTKKANKTATKENEKLKKLTKLNDDSAKKNALDKQELQETIKKLQEENKTATKENEKFKKLKDKTTKRDAFEKEELETNIKELQEENKTATKENEKFKKLTKLNDDSAKKNALDKEKLETNIKALQEQNKTDAKEIEKLNKLTKLNDDSAKGDALEKEELETNIRKLEGENEEAATANKTLKDKIAVLSQKTDSELMMLTNEVEKKKKELKETRADNEDLRQEINRLEKDNAASTAETEQMKQKLASQEESEQLKSTIEELRGEYKIALATCDELRGELNRRALPSSAAAADPPMAPAPPVAQKDAYIAYNFLGEVVDANESACYLTAHDKETLSQLLISDLETSKYTGATISKIIDRRTNNYKTSLKRSDKTEIKVSAAGELISKDNKGVIFITYKPI